MAEGTFAARLRKEAAGFREFGAAVACTFEVAVEMVGDPPVIKISPDEADTIADALDAADRVTFYHEVGPSLDTPEPKTVTVRYDDWCQLRDALARLALKSAEGQPGS